MCTVSRCVRPRVRARPSAFRFMSGFVPVPCRCRPSGYLRSELSTGRFSFAATHAFPAHLHYVDSLWHRLWLSRHLDKNDPNKVANKTRPFAASVSAFFHQRKSRRFQFIWKSRALDAVASWPSWWSSSNRISPILYVRLLHRNRSFAFAFTFTTSCLD